MTHQRRERPGVALGGEIRQHQRRAALGPGPFPSPSISLKSGDSAAAAMAAFWMTSR